MMRQMANVPDASRYYYISDTLDMPK